MTDTVVAVGQTPAQIELPPTATAVLVLNSSEGIGDRQNAPNVVVDNTVSCSLTPLVGCKLAPGQMVEMPLLQPPYDQPLPLYAVADGPKATVTLTLFLGDDCA
jgi:hypothetical protein